ncbi:MAG: GNAT family N-acetyltransferase [Pontiellaceae bacterium]|nr:GNAT family N-acetyltransferase [Pontiellaceae bacterium]MBN2783271.1 GNAT family N-acetyltransferase [Pontiellaceae bacterium]
MSPTLCADVVCRRVGLNRIDDLLALEDACFPTDRAKRRNLRRLLLSPSAYCVAAYLRGDVVGSMVVLFRSNSGVARVYSLAVSHAARGLGIGRRMMAGAEREARRRGCDRMRLEVRMDNIPAIRLYESLGFVDTQVLPGYYEDESHAFVMRKELG